MNTFQFRYFELQQSSEVHKFGTDSMLLGTLAQHQNPQNILDIGTGTGVLALMLAQKYKDALITAVDLNPEGIALARLNFSAAPFKNEFKTLQGSIIDVQFNLSFDLIISNPPYFNNALKSENTLRNLARHDDALSFYDLLFFASQNLTVDGLFWCVIPFDRKTQLIAISKEVGLSLTVDYTIYGNLNKPVRSVLAMSKSAKFELKNEELTIRDEQGNYTKEYQLLTKDFHKSDVFSA